MANVNGGLVVNKQTAPNVQLTPQKKMQSALEKMLPEIKKAVGKTMTPERFSRIALSLFNGNPQFWEADTTSFLSALMQSAQCGLEPNTVLGEAYVIPYKNNKQGITEVNFQVGYKGILKMAFNTGEYEAIYAHEVRKGDEFEYEYGLHKTLVHKPADIPSDEVTHYYAVYKLKNGGFDFVVWSKERVEHHAREFSKNYTYKGNVNKNSVWFKNFDSMAKKTVLLDVLKYAPKSVEMAKALDLDYKAEAKEEKLSNFNYVDVDAVDVNSIDTEEDIIKVNKDSEDIAPFLQDQEN
ncbi:recombinase RecT [Clostridium botulinum A2 117]|uniref:Recombinational DNA repair protein RecT (Prophage associated) n=1 Tax=Clostridium botulinum CFSAN001627 TaxID=1232189 RepID=M1ZPT4_CLOBO|nr:recombinase RecT [Clostridium botulinum]EKN40726.1 recombinational DNA repair protein RecT (prophage associated) [Clostridium botulinum CFSAN001627]KEI79132.1 recombinase RecT [Clostridium botulinum A2 117]KEI87582.1 recombinase RecT [Clostridium botulinum B2 267]MBN3417985.1 recombinase RecT [Clostridium botulinum]MBN3442672.1 recombinase RecT [Clostridium botulinum]